MRVVPSVKKKKYLYGIVLLAFCPPTINCSANSLILNEGVKVGALLLNERANDLLNDRVFRRRQHSSLRKDFSETILGINDREQSARQSASRHSIARSNAQHEATLQQTRRSLEAKEEEEEDDDGDSRRLPLGDCNKGCALAGAPHKDSLSSPRSSSLRNSDTARKLRKMGAISERQAKARAQLEERMKRLQTEGNGPMVEISLSDDHYDRKQTTKEGEDERNISLDDI